MNETTIKLYGTSWCGHSRRSRRIFDDHQVPYIWIDIDLDQDARRLVESVNRGMRSVPTIVFPDGAILVEPSDDELKKKMGFPE